MGHHPPVGGQDFQQAFAGLGGIQAAKADAEFARQRLQTVQQVPEAAPLFAGFSFAEVEPIVPQMDATEDNLAVAGRHQPGHLADNVVHGAAGEPGPDRGDDAVGAVEQAAVLHLHKGALVASEAPDAW